MKKSSDTWLRILIAASIGGALIGFAVGRLTW
jgi:hypothetical protein